MDASMLSVTVVRLCQPRLGRGLDATRSLRTKVVLGHHVESLPTNIVSHINNNHQKNIN